MSKLNKNYYKELPEGYTLNLEMNATSPKIKIYGNIISLLVFVVVFLGTILLKCSFKDLFAYLKDNDNRFLISYIITFIISFGYIVLHEIVHGIAYKALTGEKLVFGLKFPVAYCGVPNIYSSKKTALISLLAPFTVFNVIFIVPLFFINDLIIYVCMSFLLAMHLSGCIFDIYDTLLIIFKYHHKQILMYDDGPCQKFYVFNK